MFRYPRVRSLLMHSGRGWGGDLAMCVFVYTCVCVRACVGVCMGLCVHVSVRACLYECASLSVCVLPSLSPDLTNVEYIWDETNVNYTVEDTN